MAHTATTASPTPTTGVAIPRSVNKLLGQRIMVGFTGIHPSASLLQAIQAGNVGSVILYAENIASGSQTRSLTSELQRAARAGDNPGLLIATDQEGGEVKRLADEPPNLSPPQMVATGHVSTATEEGRATGSTLRNWGINMDLAPVSDVPTSRGSFIWQEGRAFSFHPAIVSQYASAFAFGLQSRRVAATAKAFPGLGTAPVDTDDLRQELHPSARQLAGALQPYRAMIPKGLDGVMLAMAGFPAYDHSGTVAALSAPIINGLLRGRLKFRGVTITEALREPSGYNETSGGVLAARAGADILLFADSAPGELAALRAALHGGRIPRADADASYERIIALKRKLGLS
jgi:beta-N-acetylhexosaminidase